MKKIVSAFLALVIALSLTVTAFANDSVPVEELTTLENKITEQPEDFIDGRKSDTVARFSICSCMSTPVIAGHTYIYLENLSDHPLQVGLYEVPVGQGVSVGTLSISVHDGWGIYYNIETYREPREGHFPQIWSKTIELDEEGVKKLDKKLDGFVNYWGPFFNCSFFAFAVWNSIAGDFLIPLVIPGLSHLVVMAVGEEGVLELYKSEPTQVFRQKGTGKSAYLVPVSEKTLEIG